MSLRPTYSFDDILITPRHSYIKSRSDIHLYTKLTDTISLKIPIISSPMDTVTEDAMAISMSMAGGLGIIHRFQSIESQVKMVNRVKRHLSYVIENPYTIKQTAKYTELVELCKSKQVSGIIVIDDESKFVGIVSKRDMDLYKLTTTTNTTTDTTQVKNIMTPKEKVQYVSEYNYDKIVEIYREHKVEKIPIINSNNELCGLVVFKNLMYFHNNKNIFSLDKNGKLLVGAAIGITGDFLERATKLIDAGVDILCVDVANGHNQVTLDTVRLLKEKFPNVPIMAGNVCTPEGYENLCLAGADCIRVGIGNGSICSTRLETGIGVCQFTALMDCAAMAKKYNVPMISDGGHCGKTGNKFKALAVGASCMILGKSLAGTTESPGKVMYKGGRRFKYYRGMASAMANLSKQERTGNLNVNTNFHVEGVEGEIEYKGSVQEQIVRICNGIRSGMSYLGVSSIESLHKTDIVFTKMTSSGVKETSTRI